MRDIRFRGKRKDDGEWVEGCITYGDTPPMARMYGPKGFIAEVIPETVGQFTDLKDKDGKKIYEGDICTANWHYAITSSNESHKLIGTIEWDAMDLIWRFDYGHGSVALSGESLTDIKQIGTLYENPELLESDAKQ